MSKETTIKIRLAEAEHLLHLIEINEREHMYYGSYKQYRKRSDDLKNKLLLAINELINK
jgi:hypothetical protein